MADALAVFRSAVDLKVEALREVVDQLPLGRGSSLGSLVEHTLKRFDSARSSIEREITDAGADVALLTTASRKLERLSLQLDVLHQVLAKYQTSVGRADVPVGLQHLIDELMRVLLKQTGDPIVHLNQINMYSTVDLVKLLDELLRGPMSPTSTYTGTHPIAFNLPALDPANALLSPIIAHEVTHAAVEESLMNDLQSQAGDDGSALLLQTLASAGLSPTGPEALEWTTRFRGWCAELLCDAVALAITGPSFLLAFVAFAPPSNFAIVNTHPPVRDRIEFHLGVLDRLGWTELLEEQIPETLAWLRGVAAAPALLGSPEEAFLRGAMRIFEDRISKVALGHVVTPLDPSSVRSSLDAATEFFRLGAPVVEVGGATLSPWQVVLLGWITGFQDHGDQPTSIIDAVRDRGFNSLLIKALEMSSIVTAWRANERARA